MIKVAIFDLDGTLLYTLEDLKDSTNFALEKFGFEPRTLEEVRNFVGNGVRKLMERCVPQGLQNPSFEACLQCFKEHYKKHMYNKTKPFDGITEMLKNLKQNDIKCAVVSNKFDTAVKELCAKYFGNLLDVAIGESPQIRKKPCPDSVLSVIDSLKISKENCIYIGDSEVDIQTADNANIPCISVIWGYKTKNFLIKNNARIIVETPKDLENYILNN